MLIPFGRCATDSLHRSVGRGRFRLMSNIYTPVVLCATDTQRSFFVDRWKEIVVVITESRKE